MSDGVHPTVLVIGAGPAACAPLLQPLDQAGFRVSAAFDSASALELIHTDPPQCVILPHGQRGTGTLGFLAEMKADNVYGHLPVILTLPDGRADSIDWTRERADDYLTLPVNPAELVARVRLCIARAQRDINANPLTGLPGNLTIMREAEHYLERGTPFAMAYLDIDYFKAYNDRYGFSRGDEVLRMSARIIVNAIRTLNHPETYVGHVGGDDFIFIAPPDQMEKVCREILRNFDLVVPNFYDEEDRVRGEIQSVDRQGNPQTFPLMGCSIAVVDTSTHSVSHLADISARTAEIKKIVKSLPGSNYLIDRRK